MKKEFGRASAPVSAPDSRFLTPKQLARILQVSPRSIRRRIKEGMPHVRINNTIRFDLDEIRAWAKSRR